MRKSANAKVNGCGDTASVSKKKKNRKELHAEFSIIPLFSSALCKLKHSD